MVDSLLIKLREMMVETSAIRSNLTGVKGSVNTVGVDSLNDILAKCMAVYDSNNAVKDSIRAYRYTLISCEIKHHHNPLLFLVYSLTLLQRQV